jgi:aspartate racemase
MKTIGLLGGMSWQSTISYYRAINQGVNKRLGGFHSAKICMNSVDFDEIEKLQQAGDWSATAEILSKAACSIESAGADFLLICTNTMHKVATDIEASITIPLLHIADATGERLVEDHVGRVGLIGTKFTMEEEFYKTRLTEKFGVEVVIPDADARETVHDVIYQELCQGEILDSSREKYLRIIESLQTKGAEAVILGCTEIALLVQQQDTAVPLYDTTEIHASQAVRMAIL